MRKLSPEFETLITRVFQGDVLVNDQADFQALLTLHMAGVYSDGYDAGYEDGYEAGRVDESNYRDLE